MICQFCNVNLRTVQDDFLNEDSNHCPHCNVDFYPNAGYDIFKDKFSYIYIDANDITIQAEIIKNNIVEFIEIKLDFDPKITPQNIEEKINKILQLKNFI